VSEDALFTREEASVALELIDGALARPDRDYNVLVAEGETRAPARPIDGYVCFGPTPMTAGTWDLYWIVTHPEARGRGVARALVERMEHELRQRGARIVRVETSHLDGYGAARAFYERMRYPVVARVADFYRPGDDLLIMMKRL
jgi:ribosomal protein S18 acetylase RimI-like enzyme